MQAVKTATMKPHSELFKTEKGELVEVEWLIVSNRDWNEDVLSDDVRFRVRALPNARVLALRVNA
jgi:hypothetical protein